MCLPDNKLEISSSELKRQGSLFINIVSGDIIYYNATHPH